MCFDVFKCNETYIGGEAMGMKKQYTVQLEPEFVENIDKLAEKLGLTRSQMMRNLMESAYQDAILLDKVGLFKAVVLGEKVMTKFKEAVLTGKITLDSKGELKVRK
jgi:hypothetical protein